MSSSISPELFYLALTAGLTGTLWMAYIINRILEQGVWATLKTPNLDKAPQANWAHRMMRAHNNAVDNLVVFTALVLAVQLSHANNEMTATTAMIFFYARLAHAVTYAMGIPVFRTLAFVAGFICQAVLFIQVIAG